MPKSLEETHHQSIVLVYNKVIVRNGNGNGPTGPPPLSRFISLSDMR